MPRKVEKSNIAKYWWPNRNCLFLHLQPWDWMKPKLKAWHFISSNLIYMALSPHQGNERNWRYDGRGSWIQESAQVVLMFLSSLYMFYSSCLIGGFIMFHPLKSMRIIGDHHPTCMVQNGFIWNHQPLYSHWLYQAMSPLNPLWMDKSRLITLQETN